MYTHNHGTGSKSLHFCPRVVGALADGVRSTDAPQGYAVNPAFVPPPGFVATPAFVPPPGFVVTPHPAPAPAPVPAQALVPVPTPTHTPRPITPVLAPVQVPPGCYPIEIVQFWRNESKRGQPFPLHWALFLRTAPPSPTPRARSGHHVPSSTPRGNFYELAGSTDTYTAQFLSNVTFSPETLPDWRGTHVIGWVHPAQLGVFERVARQAPVWRHRPDWRCQQWVYEVVRAVGGNYQGLFMDGVTFVELQKHMGRLLDAWENGDI